MKTELAELKKGATWQNLYDALWHIALARYVTYQQLKIAFPPNNKSNVWCNKIITPQKIRIAVEHGLIIDSDSILRITRKGIEFLTEYSKYNTKIIKLAEGKGEKDKSDIAGIVLELTKQPDFYAVFYPEFYENKSDQQTFLRPDGALVLKQNSKAKLVFLEIEQQKPNWQAHIEGKRRKYNLIAGREQTWGQWWRHWCGLLNFELCPIEKFGFSVWCIGNFKPKADWYGWQFLKIF